MSYYHTVRGVQYTNPDGFQFSFDFSFDDG